MDLPVPTERLAAHFEGSETVLLVEDSDIVRETTRSFLEAHGYKVLQAKTGPRALALAQRHAGTIDLLLTDVVMPRMSGPQLVERLKKLRPTVKVLYMSGYAGDAINHHGVSSQGAGFLQKPFTWNKLGVKLRQIVDG